MIETIKGTTTMTCDVCGNFKENEEDYDFAEWLSHCKKDGWKITFKEDEFFHFCTKECKEKSRLAS
jgi:hypothetical protein